MSVMRVRYKKLGGHYHCRVFTARRADTTYAKNGELVFDDMEWEDVKKIMNGAEFLPEEPPLVVEGP